MKTHPAIRGLCAVAAVFALFASQASAAFITIGAERETAIFAENPDYNLGSGNLIAGTNAFGGDNARSLLGFNIAASIPSGSIINSVTFQIGVIRQSNRNSASAYELHRMLTDWTEGNGGINVNTGSPALAGETTWNSRHHGSTPWSTPGGQAGVDYLSLVSGTGPEIDSGNTVYEILSSAALVADVQSWLNSPGTDNGWMFLATEEGTPGTARRFSSSEVPGAGISSALTPRILVDFTAVPEPATACTGLALGLVAFGRTLRRRRIR